MDDLLSKQILMLDGGLGTTLEDQYDMKFSTTTPLWSSHLLVEGSQTLSNVQKSFAQAGADVILTATYQTSFEGFAKTRTEQYPEGIKRDKAEELMREAVDISRFAFDGRPGLVALSLGAYGAVMIPSQEYSGQYGNLDDDDLFNFHFERLSVFVDGLTWSKIDIVAFETLPLLREITACRRAIRQIPDGKPYWLSCVFPEGDLLPDGSSIEEVVQEMMSGARPPFAIGLNCTKVEKVPTLIRHFEAAASELSIDLPRLVIYPDGAGGLVYDTMRQQWVGSGDEDSPWDLSMEKIVKQVTDRGKWKGLIVGGCCKTTPDHIAKLKQRLSGVI